MVHFQSFGQDSGPTFQAGYAAMPAGATLMRARLHCITSFTSAAASGGIGWAPPNTLLGISYRPAGTGPELVSLANLGDGTWYTAGMGTMTACDTYIWNSLGGTEPNVIQQTYATTIELDLPQTNAASYGFGISINWQGGGFWPSPSSFLSYQFDAWYT